MPAFEYKALDTAGKQQRAWLKLIRLVMPVVSYVNNALCRWISPQLSKKSVRLNLAASILSAAFQWPSWLYYSPNRDFGSSRSTR